MAVGVFAFLGKLAGAAKEMAVAWRYGVSAEVDAFLFVYNLVSLPVSIWFSVLSVVLIPLAARLSQGPPEEWRRFRAELLGVTMVAGIGLAVTGLVFLPGFLSSTWVGLPAATASLAVRMVPVLAWLVPAGLLVGLYSTWVMTKGGHANTLLEGVPALGILVGVLLLGGIEPLVWGVLAGTMVQLSCLAAVSEGRTPEAPALSLSAPAWAPFWQGFGVMLLGQAIMSFTGLIDQFFAARLGEGAISALGYAMRIIALVLGVVATALTRATLPVFSQARIEGVAGVRRLAFRWAGLMALAGCAALLLGWLLAPWAVRLLFQRGTFTAGDTTTVAQLLRLGLIQLPFYFASLVLVSLTSSLGRYRLLLASGVLGLSVKALASYLLLPYLGVGGLMLSHAVVYAANTLLLARLALR